jgi:hypothetical protein
MDPVDKVYTRSVEYVVVNIVVTQFLRSVNGFTPLRKQGLTAIRLLLVSLVPASFKSKVNGAIRLDDDEDERSSEYAEDEEATEDTRFLGGGRTPSTAVQVWDGITTNLLLFASLVGILIGLIKPIQRVLVGDLEHFTGGWQSLGGGLIILGGSYAVVEMLAIGATIRAGEKK